MKKYFTNRNIACNNNVKIPLCIYYETNLMININTNQTDYFGSSNMTQSD